jgi:glycosyltransferase involved in cell wall biosynthesis
MKKIVFIRPADVISPRIRKLTDICENVFDEVIFLGGKRSDSPTYPESDKVVFKLIGISYPYSSLKYIIGTAVFVCAALWNLVKEKPKAIHGSDLEGAIPAILYKFFFRKTYVIINVHDNFFARYKVPERVNRFLKYVEFSVYNRADICLFPDDNRIKLFAPYSFKNTWAIPNTPVDPGYKAPSNYDGKEKIKLFLAGFVSKVRGLDTLLDYVSSSKEVELHVAGRASEEDMAKINKVENAIFHGRMSQHKVLELGKLCHIVPIFYAPDVEIHIYASPNKLYDAFALGRPVIMNKEINVSQIVEDYQMGALVKYGAVEEIRDAVKAITSDRLQFINRCEQIRSFYEKEFKWEVYAQKIEAFFQKIKEQ